MTRKRAKQLWPVIQAYAEGKTVQQSETIYGTAWCDVAREGDVSFLDNVEYRIKVEPPREFWLALFTYPRQDLIAFSDFIDAKAYAAHYDIKLIHVIEKESSQL